MTNDGVSLLLPLPLPLPPPLLPLLLLTTGRPIETRARSEGFALLCPGESATLTHMAETLQAKRDEGGDAWLTLMFRHAVAARGLSGWGGASEANLLEATLGDHEQVFCFLRFLDTDCDGVISKDDFCAALRYPDRWPKFRRHAAS